MGFFGRRKKHTEVKRWQAEEDSKEFVTDVSNTSAATKKSSTTINHNSKKPRVARNVSYVIHPQKQQKEFVLRGFGPGKAKFCTDGQDNGYYHLRLNAISRGGKRGSVVHDTPLKFKVNPKWILPKPRNNDVTKMVDLSLYRQFPKYPMATEARNQIVNNKHGRIERENKRKEPVVDHHKETYNLPIISENTYKIRFPDLAPQVVPHDISNKKLRDELYIGYGWAGDNESLTVITKRLHRYREFSIKNSSQSRERGEENIAMQRREIAKYLAPPKLTLGEAFHEYWHELKEADLGDDKPPGLVPVPRVRRIIEEGSYPNWTVVEDDLPTLLRYTWKGKQNKIIRYLRDESKHHKINNEDNQGRTALHYAASWGCIKILRILLRVPGIDVNMRDKDGKTPLYKAVERDSFECVQALIEAGANCRTPARDSRDPITAIMHLYGDERFEMFKKLYEYGGYGDEEVEPYFLTLLHRSIAADICKVNLKIVNFLIENGADINAKEGKSRTPLHCAAICGRADLFYLLLAHGANIFQVDNYVKDVNFYVTQDKFVLRNLLNDFHKHGPPSIVLALTFWEDDGEDV